MAFGSFFPSRSAAALRCDGNGPDTGEDASRDGSTTLSLVIPDPLETAGPSPEAAHVLVVEHERDVDLGLIAGRLAAAGVVVDIVGPERGRDIPGDLGGYDGLIVLGGTMDPVDDDGAPWLPQVRQLLRDAVRDQLPTMGVCLGAQLLGMAVGGTARRIPAGPEVGLVRIRPTGRAAEDPLLGQLGPNGRRALAWHWWEVTDLPDAYLGEPVTVLAESDACPVHAFVVGEAVWGIQFHLEALGPTAKRWASDDPERLVGIGVDPDALIEQVAAAEQELKDGWFPVVDAWIALLRP